ncbi:uncharacterized protein LOC109848538 [Asparagus officinalis]|uniref:uncharacterized protein LOC109848538 n=1 Tax=Asparagus officinalis TaxID=4686 RepID=UPI00098DE651|nr:uncharacterized protein LOC109848538 [Asparagus officinalis]
MKKLCPNLDREDGLDTVLEIPIPEETFASSGSTKSSRGTAGCSSMLSWMRRPNGDHHRYPPPSPLGHGAELQLMLGVIGAPLVPLPVQQAQASINGGHIKKDPIEASMAKYIVQQYVAAAGGKAALSAVSSMYAMGKVCMSASEICNNATISNASSKKGTKNGGGEMGGFVLWQKKPDVWCIELVVSGSKLSAGSDGKVAWRQAQWQQSHASRGPPRPLRRTLQGLDPRSTASLFSNAVCIGEKAINGEDCFVLRLDAEPKTLRARSSSSVEIIRHTVWGYFSQRTGLLVQLDDSHLLRMRGANNESAYWETTMESLIEDYRHVDGIKIAHSGRTAVSLFRFGETTDGHVRTQMEEIWTVEEVDFNIQGLSMDCFLPPADLQEEKESNGVPLKNGLPPKRIHNAVIRLGSSKVAAIDIVDSVCLEEEYGRQ